MVRGSLVVALCVAATAPRLAWGQSLKGSSLAVAKAYTAALEIGAPFAKTAAHVEQLVKAGTLVEVRPGPDLTLNGVSFPYATPALDAALAKLSARYRAACGEQLVLTSLVRPLDQQPANASRRSVHPAGTAADIRRSKNERCLVWLETALLELEGEGAIEATRESRPPHYHVAVLPQRAPPRDRDVDPAEAERVAEAPAGGLHTVAPNESLWAIAHRFGTTIDAIKALNGLADANIKAGQRLAIPLRSSREASPE
jgi:hypothetical protein